MNITIVIGSLCSGKSTYAKQLQDQLHQQGQLTTIIEVGSIVRELVAHESRHFDKTLDTQIIEELNKMIFHCLTVVETQHLIIVGIRQLSILKAMILKSGHLTSFGNNMQIKLLKVDDQTRAQRYESRNANKDVQLVFSLADRHDNSLGLNELINFLTQQSPSLVQVVNHQ